MKAKKKESPGIGVPEVFQANDDLTSGRNDAAQPTTELPDSGHSTDETPVYYVGDPSNMGRVSRLSASTFAELVEQVITQPQPVPFTSAELLAMPKAQQAEAKKSAYIVPCAFTGNPSPREKIHATEAHLLCLDVDDAAEAGRILTIGPSSVLGELNAVVWHTARSTPEAPRLRVIVATTPVPAEAYAKAIEALASRIGISVVTPESKVSVQPMYLPLKFKNSILSPIIYEKTDGRNFDCSHLEGTVTLGGTSDDCITGAELGDITFLRDPVDGLTEAQVREVLKRIPADCSRKRWVDVGMALKHQFGEVGFALWDEWSATAPNNYPDGDEIVYQWKSFHANPKDRVPITIRSVFRYAGVELPPDWRFVEKCAREEQRGDAALFARLTRDQYLYDHTENMWRIYTNGVWQIDRVRAVRAAAKPVIAEPYKQLAITKAQEINEDLDAGRLDAKQAKKDPREELRRLLLSKIARLNHRKYIDDVIHLAGDFLPCRAEQLDMQPHLLNLLNGTLDLTSGVFREHDPRDNLSKQAAVEYRPGAQCPRWCAFVDTLFDGDVEKVEFLRRALGYSLSGATDHDFLVFCLGSGRNGKSTLLQVPQALLGDYFSTLPIEAILAQARGQRDNQASAELARLHGARMVLSSEIPEGRKLNESVVKDITAGDQITARMLYANPFSFKPTHKLWLMGNHKPEIRGLDEGIWRRICLLTFNHSFPKSGEPGFRERKAVVDELLAEGAGILNWLLKGYADIKAKGLNPPDSVKFQTDAYREESDPLAEFIAERCVVGPEQSCKSHDLWEHYCSYSAGGTRAYQSQRALTDALGQRGFKAKRTSSARMIDGIAPFDPGSLS